MTGNTDTISILHITDPHILATPQDILLGVNTADTFKAVLTHACGEGKAYDLCLLTGDLAQEGNLGSYRHILAELNSFGLPSLCLPGNHDDYSMMQQVFNTETVNCVRLRKLGNWLIVGLNSQILDSEAGYLAYNEMAFLTEGLTIHPGLHTLIAVHHHSIPTGSDWMDTMMIQNSDEFATLLAGFPNVKAVLNGHIHQEMTGAIGHAVVYTTPSTCFQFKPKSEIFRLDNLSPGYRRLTLQANGDIVTEVIRIPEKLKGLELGTKGY